MHYVFIAVLHLGVSLVPFVDWDTQHQKTNPVFQAWPTEFEGLPLTRLEMTDKERGFINGFPGKIARFTEGSREIIMRYVEKPSRKLHPSADCFRGSGYNVEPEPISRDQKGNLWGCVIAERKGISYRVCERVYDQSGNSWYDVSSWFWSVILKNSQGPWWAITVAERI
ncbi:MAG: hypothetical protein L3J59_11530 [Methylococcaceae bacterium]|nr:hypothetical protein [Methylococcaceae bacterium]